MSKVTASHIAVHTSVSFATRQTAVLWWQALALVYGEWCECGGG